MTLEILTSDALGDVRHGFFTRRGGVSAGLYDGLNCGPGSADAADAVAENRARVAKALGVAPTHLMSLHQTHSADVITVSAETAPWAGARPKADGMVTRDADFALGVLAADCMPVLYADPASGVVGAAHAGWRGAQRGVLEAVADAMVAEGAERSRIHATIGPCISQRAYEVGPEFFDSFMEEDSENARYFAGGKEDRMQFDLPGYALGRLRGAGIGADWIGHCTYSDTERFYSYRRSCHAGEPDYGRQIAAIRP
ncbi:MAG: peptidoglycan editing factor PgeF [Pseudomonadota bacterium]